MTDKAPTHYNQYRLHIVINSESVQLYFDTYEEKEAYRLWAAKNLGFDTSAGLIRNSVKRANAMSTDLPIGLAETVGDTKRGVKRGYGDKRTRAQAIAEVTQLRLAYTESLK